MTPVAASVQIPLFPSNPIYLVTFPPSELDPNPDVSYAWCDHHPCPPFYVTCPPLLSLSPNPLILPSCPSLTIIIPSIPLISSIPSLISLFFFSSSPSCPSTLKPPHPLQSTPPLHALPPNLQMQSLYGTRRRSRPCVCR